MIADSAGSPASAAAQGSGGGGLECSGFVTRVAMHVFYRRPEETWRQRHFRTWREAGDAITRDWGHHPAMSIMARAVAGVGASAARLATYVLGGVLRWRSAAEVHTTQSLVGKGIGPWFKHSRGRPKLPREGPRASVVGNSWWATADSRDALSRCPLSGQMLPRGDWRRWQRGSPPRSRPVRQGAWRFRHLESRHSRSMHAEDGAHA